MAKGNRKGKPSPEELSKLFELTRNRNHDAFALFDSLFRKLILRRLKWSGIPQEEFDALYREVVLCVWFSAPKLQNANGFLDHVDYITQRSIKYFVSQRLKKRKQFSDPDTLEALIHNLVDSPDKKTLKDAKDKALRVLEDIRQTLHYHSG